ncbi:MAG: hypothetical protein J7L32_05070 [Thermoplasmata archaeon]|nr:hypothetical protein [Thermoplasmata archaeon]
MVLFSANISLTSASFEEGNVTLFYRTVSVYAPAVARTSNGLVGVTSTITVTVQNGTGCSGKVFVETLPLTQIDMQGSARLAVMVAGTLTGIDISNYDFFFVIQTSSPIIGGPSAGAVMTIATIAALEGWQLDNRTMMTGMIDPDGSIGPVGGIPEKIEAAYSVGATRFLFPKGQGVMYKTVTETKNMGGIIQIVQKRVPIDISEYAMNNFGIEAIEVADINEALLYFTGHTFETHVSNETITTSNYTTSMEPLALHLINDANNSYATAKSLFENTKSDIPNSFPFYYRNQINDMLDNAQTSLEKARDSYEKKLFYSSTSSAFQSLINSRFVQYASNYFNTDDRGNYLDNLFNTVESFVSNQSEKAKDATIKGMTSLQCVGAAQKRAFDAEDYLKNAQQDYQKRDYLNALYKLAFAFERSKSVGWWLNMSSTFEDIGQVNNSVLDDVAHRYLDLAIQANTYSSIILQEMGESSSLLSGVGDLIDDAGSEIEEYPASSLFASLEALAKANLALELVDGAKQDKLDKTRESAATAISESRSLGIEPILAVSYFEFAQTLENGSTTDAIVYYRYAQMIAGALHFMVSPPVQKQSRFEGIPPINPPQHNSFVASLPFDLKWVYAAATLLVVMLIVGAAVIAREKRFKKEFPPEMWMPRSMEEYYRKH